VLTSEDLKAYTEILTDAVEGTRITDWERSFANDILGRFERVGEHADLSEKQIEIVRRIEKKIYGT
jgi:hypothetical protein